jgi:quinoprotein glucose dehydrogenase
MPERGASRPPRVFAGILALFGAALAGGGAWLLGLGGSPYYVLMGTAILASAVLLWRGNAVGSAIFQLAVVATLLWAIWEAGFDIWALLPRIALPILLMAWLYMPWVRRGLAGDDDDALPRAGGEIHAPKHATASVALVLLGGAALLGIQQLQAQEGTSGRSANGQGTDPATGAHYATLDQINENTVGRLERAWTFDFGTESGGTPAAPVEADGIIFACTPGGEIVAVDGASGEERWRVSPQSEDAAGNVACSGLAIHASAASGVCSQKLIGTRGHALFALDTASGALCTAFGENGVIALPGDAGRPLVTGNTIFTAQDEAAGGTMVSAFAAEDGRERWSWRDADGAGVAILAPLSGDAELNLLYVATGSPQLRTDGSAPSAFERSFANAVVALDAATGTLR